jgi:hypothetical protein
MEIAFLPPAKGELTEVIRYYNTQSEGLGYEFAVEVKRTLGRIAQYPARGSNCQIVLVVAGPIDSHTGSSIRSGMRPCSLWQ